MPLSGLWDRAHRVAAGFFLFLVAAAMGCGAQNLELLREDVLGEAGSNWELPGVPLDYMASSVKQSVVEVRIDCENGQKQQGSAFIVKRSGKRAFLISAWHLLHPPRERCQVDRIFLDGTGIVALSTEVRPGNLDDLLAMHGSELADIVLFSVPAQPEGPSLQLVEPSTPAASKALMAWESVGGPVILAATGQVVGVVTERTSAGTQAYKMAPVSALLSELRVQADLDLREQVAPYGLDPLESPPLARPEEAATVHELLRRSPAPWVLLTGKEGVGKGALANKLGWDAMWSGQFPDGVVRVQVRARPTDEVLGELHKVILRRPPQPALDSTVNTLASVLRGKRLLVVLDDLRFEGDRLPVELEKALAETAVLATSRRPYTGPRIQPIEVGNLPPNLARQVLESALNLPPEYKGRASSLPDVDLLCQRLGYNPLALSLAAGVMSKAQLGAEAYLLRWQQQPPNNLSQTADDAALSRAFEVMWQGLSASERAALVGMGLLAEAPVAPDLLAALIDEDQATVAAALDHLVAQHVLSRPSRGREVSTHPLIYRFIQEKGAQVWFKSHKRERLVRWFILHAQDLPAQRWGLGIIAQLQATQEWAAGDDKLGEVYGLADAYHNRLREFGPWSLWDRMWRNAVESALHANDQKILMLALRQLARTREQAGYKSGAEPLFRESLKIARDLRDQRAVIETLQDLGAQENGTEAVLLVKTSLEQAQLLGDRALIAHTLLRLSQAYAKIPDFANAKKSLKQSLDIYQILIDNPQILNTMQSLYQLALREQDLDSAKGWLASSIAVCERLGDLKCAVPIQLNLARLADQRGNPSEAQQHYDRALSLARRVSEPDFLATVLDELARRAGRREELAAALLLWRQARDNVQNSADLKLKINVAIFGAELAYRLRDYAQADEQLDLALNLCARTGDRASLLAYIVQFHFLRWSRTSLARQLTRLQDARQQAELSHAENLVPLLDLAIARIFRLRHEPDRAQELISRSASLSGGRRSELAVALFTSGHATLSAMLGEHTSPRAGLTRAVSLCEKAKEDSRLSCLRTVGEDAAEIKQWVPAQKCQARRLALLRAQSETPARAIEIASVVEETAELAMARGDRKGAQRRYQEALGLWQHLHADLAVARVLERLARLAWERGDTLLAQQWLQEALSVSRSLDSKGDTFARMRLLQAQIARRRNQREQARAFASEACELFERLHSNEAAAARAFLKKL